MLPLGMDHRYSFFPSSFVTSFSMFVMQRWQVKSIRLRIRSEMIAKRKYIPLKLKHKAKTKILYSNFVPLTFFFSVARFDFQITLVIKFACA